MTDAEIAKAARNFAYRHSGEIIGNFVGDAVCRSVPKPGEPFVIFMAGSPGAGKTEWSKHLIEIIGVDKYGIARIDADDFRPYLPKYSGDNSHLFQEATSALLANAYESALKHRKNCILDTTFSKTGTALQNVGKALKLDRRVEIVFVYQEPMSAWEFTQKREAKEGRRVPKEVFADTFVNASKTVNEIKAKFGEGVLLTVVIKDVLNGQDPTVKVGALSVADHIAKKYTKDDILKLIQ